MYFLGLTLYVALMAYWINFSESFILRRYAWGTTSGAITGCQNFLKDSLTIIKASDGKWPIILYLLSSLAAITAFVGLLFLTACMKKYDATYASASFVGSFVVSASIMAAVHYNTFTQLSGILNNILYPCGIIVLMGGVFLLVGESNEELRQESDSIDQERQLNSNNGEETNCDSQVRILQYLILFCSCDIVMAVNTTNLKTVINFRRYYCVTRQPPCIFVSPVSISIFLCHS